MNNNNYFIGLMMIFLNLGTKYLMQEFGGIIDYIFRFKLLRRLVLFTVFFIGTRNIKVSIILTGIVTILTLEIFNEKSKNCLLPKSLIKSIEKLNTQKEIEQALGILKKHKINLTHYTPQSK